MSVGRQRELSHMPFWRLLARRDVLAGLLFVGVAALGLRF
jgi:carbon starvation protein CstA